MLPFEQAVRLPFVFFHKVRFGDLSGTVLLNSPNVHRGMIKIGKLGSGMFPRNHTVINIEGFVQFTGRTNLGCGSLLNVKKNAKVFLGDKVSISANSKIYCEESISFGNQINVSWECQIFDTDFHYMQSLDNGSLFARTRPVTIGSYCWIANRVNVMKGTVLPDHTIVASNSLCNKDYSNISEYSVVGGSPAKLLKQGVKRMFEGIDIKNP
jgi:acetyltransferase-like isoleucine patch superfamily enzyme